MMQGTKPSSSTKKLAKMNMLSIFSRVSKARKVKEFFLKWTTTMMSKGLMKMTRSL